MNSEKTRTRTRTKKSFIGPLGDDIPSIFPIVFSVLLFTGSILYANQLISEKARAIEIREGAIALSYLVTEKGFMEVDVQGNPLLEKTCEEKVNPRAASLDVKYLITLKRFCKGIPSSFDYNDVNRVRTPARPEFLNPYFQAGNSNSIEKTNAFYLAKSNDDGETWRYCSNSKEFEDFIKRNPNGGLMPQPKQSVLLSYPIAVPCPNVDSFTLGLGVVNVVSWK